MTIHPTALIDANVTLESNVVVGPYAVLSGEIKIGHDVERIGAFTHIRGPTHIGSGTIIDSHASIGGPPQDKKTATLKSQLIIGENNRIREYVTINRGTTTTRIGNDNWLMAYSHIAHVVSSEMDVHSQMVQLMDMSLLVTTLFSVGCVRFTNGVASEQEP